jgi:uncharacterized protein (TIGR00725 family)
LERILAAHTIGVMGSGVEEHDDHAAAVGRLLARLGVNLLTGGGGGVMRAVARAYTHAERTQGISLGVIPCVSEADRATPTPGYPNEFVELAIYTHLPYSGRRGTDDLSRNHINVLSSVAVIVLPGGDGTASEARLAVRYGRPVVAYARRLALLPDLPAEVPRVGDVDEVERFVHAALTRRGCP